MRSWAAGLSASSCRRAAGLLALAVWLALASPAGASERRQLQDSAFAVPTPTAPIRDLVIERPSRAQARATDSGSLARYPVNDGSGGSVEISSDCITGVTCDATPEQVAAFLGTLPHRAEIDLLSVLLVPPPEVAAECGSASAQACYFPSLDQMVINGNTAPAPDGASWEYVIAHEYGHHLANHRDNAPFDNPAIDWGPKSWASWAGVCQGVRDNRYFPGDEGNHYFQNPGEAFAESYAHNRFPSDPVPWEWPDFPAPDANGYAAVQHDALDPWSGATPDKRTGRFPKRKRPKVKKKRFATPRDGDLKVTINGPSRADLSLKLFDSGGHLIDRSDGVGSQETVNYRVCGQRSVTAVVRRRSRRYGRHHRLHSTRFWVTGLIP